MRVQYGIIVGEQRMWQYNKQRANWKPGQGFYQLNWSYDSLVQFYRVS